MRHLDVSEVSLHFSRISPVLPAVDRWASWASVAKRGSKIADIRAGAAGCSAMSLLVGAIFMVREIRMSRRNAARDTVVVADEPVKADAAAAPPS